MYNKARVFDGTPPVLVLLALFVFTLQSLAPPSCKCPDGFTFSQCNFTNLVCLTQTMFVKKDIVEPRPRMIIESSHAQMKEALGNKFEYTLKTKSLSSLDRDVTSGFNSGNDKEDIALVPGESSDKNNDHILGTRLLLHNAYPVMLFLLAVLMTTPCFIWKCACIEKDIHCIQNTISFAGTSSDETMRIKCVDQCVNDIKFFLRYFHGTLFSNVKRMYLLRIIIPLMSLLCLTFILDISLNSLLSLSLCPSGVYSIGINSFPATALCHFNILSGGARRPYTTPCNLPASPFLQSLTSLLLTWLIFLSVLGTYHYLSFCRRTSSVRQHQFYTRLGFVAKAHPRMIFGDGGFLLFSTLLSSDRANILPDVLNCLKEPMQRNAIGDYD